MTAPMVLDSETAVADCDTEAGQLVVANQASPGRRFLGWAAAAALCFSVGAVFLMYRRPRGEVFEAFKSEPIGETSDEFEKELAEWKATLQGESQAAARGLTSLGGQECACMKNDEQKKCNPETSVLYDYAHGNGTRCLKRNNGFLWCYTSPGCSSPGLHQSDEHSQCKWKYSSWFDCQRPDTARVIQLPTSQQAALAACFFNANSAANSIFNVATKLEKITRPNQTAEDIAQHVMDTITSFIGAAAQLIGAMNNCRFGLPPIVSAACAMDITTLVASVMSMASTGISLNNDCAAYLDWQHCMDEAYDEINGSVNFSDNHSQHCYDLHSNYNYTANRSIFNDTNPDRYRSARIASCAKGANSAVNSLGFLGIRISTMPDSCDVHDYDSYACAMQSLGLLGNVADIASTLAGMVSDCPIPDISHGGADCASDISGTISWVLGMVLSIDAIRVDCKNYTAGSIVFDR